MREKVTTAVLITSMFFAIAGEAEAARVKVTKTKGKHATRVRVSVRPGFPVRRTLPHVVVRPAPVVRVAPRVYLPAIAFTVAVVAALPPASARAWSGSETLEREDGWTEFTMNVDRRGKGLLLEIDRGSAQISFAEIVFENGDAQVVDFNDRVHARGIYSLIDIRDGRKVDHVRMVAKAGTRESEIRIHLVQ